MESRRRALAAAFEFPLRQICPRRSPGVRRRAQVSRAPESRAPRTEGAVRGCFPQEEAGSERRVPLSQGHLAVRGEEGASVLPPIRHLASLSLDLGLPRLFPGAARDAAPSSCHRLLPSPRTPVGAPGPASDRLCHEGALEDSQGSAPRCSSRTKALGPRPPGTQEQHLGPPGRTSPTSQLRSLALTRGCPSARPSSPSPPHHRPNLADKSPL